MGLKTIGLVTSLLAVSYCICMLRTSSNVPTATTNVDLQTKEMGSSRTGRYRVVWSDDPSHSATVAWEQQEGRLATLYFGRDDHGMKAGSYPHQVQPHRMLKFDGMTNCFARMSNLSADTEYYFVLKDQFGTSRRFKFRTAPDQPQPYTFVAGGDSRNFRDARVSANRLCTKLKPLFIAFTGDMIRKDNAECWQAWLDDWQYTIAKDGTVIPIVPHRGNHEGRGNMTIYNHFDTTFNNYYAFSIGGHLSRYYVLNSEMNEQGAQAEWLARDLAENQEVVHLMAGYHKPMRPHVSKKSEGTNEYEAWAEIFYNHGLDLAIESDSHVMKRTYALKPNPAGEEGFERADDDPRATFFIGEGCWGAPLRAADDAKSWTQGCAAFNGFDWVYVTPEEIQVQTVQLEGSSQVKSIDLRKPFAPPAKLKIWKPNGERILRIPADVLEIAQ